MRASKSTAGLHELDLLLTLFIYAAVNSEEKENVIGHIQQLNTNLQSEIAERITKGEIYFNSIN